MRVNDPRLIEQLEKEITGWQEPPLRLIQALRNNEFELFAQPIVSLAEPRRIAMAEVLVRLREEENALLPPGMFLPVFEFYGMMNELDRWVARQVVARYRVDARRVYIAGLSAGGSMAAIMAATYPELYAAVGVHSGLPYAAAHGAATAAAAMRWKRLGAAAPLPPIPMIVFHGDCDGTVHPSNGDYALPAGVRTVSGEASGRRYTRTCRTRASAS